MIRVTITKVLDDLWARPEQFAEMDDAEITELCREDIYELLDKAAWKVERLKVTHCSGCNAEIVWSKTASGKNTPVNIDGTPHWGTCPRAKDFKKAKV